MLVMVFTVFALHAAEVTALQAKDAVQSWLADAPSLGCKLGGTVEDVRTCSATNGTPFQVVRIAGGGFVVTSADTLLEPIIAFSSAGDLVENDGNPLWVLLKGDFAERGKGVVLAFRHRMRAGAGMSSAALTENEAKWAKLLGGGFRTMSGDGRSSVSDLRVAPLIQSRWGQTGESNEPCYNYYTPNNYPCGCVATAGAQIMRYFQWPSSSVAMQQFTNPYCQVNGVRMSLTTQGGSYNWGMMPLVPTSSMTVAERQAIGKLTSDIGICCGMAYFENGASIGSYMLAETFTNRFGYCSALAAQWETMDQSGTETLRRALLSNFDAGLPVVLSLKGVRYGHAVVSDGYGYSDGTLFIHMNFGWYGLSDAWYSPPHLYTGDDDDYNYTAINGFVFNILPDLPPNTVICSGRVLDEDGNPIVGAMVSYYRTNTTSGGGIQSGNDTGYVITGSAGIYALRLQPGQYVVTAQYDATESSISVTLSPNVATKTAYPNTYFYTPSPVINNLCDQDLVLSNLAGVAVPVFDPPSCLFYPTTNVSITCATSGATIRYTLDGTEPTETSMVYTGPIAISDDVVITAKAWADGMNPSVPISSTYTYDASKGAPKGDYFTDPIIISGANGSRVVADNSAYTEELGEPLHTMWWDEAANMYHYCYQYNTIWYEWTAPGSGQMTFTARLAGTSYLLPPMLAVYTGDSLSSIERIVYDADEDADYFAVASFNAMQGETYRIVGMSGYEGLVGSFTLTWSGDLTIAQTATDNTPEPVPYAGFDSYFDSKGTVSYDTLALLDSDGDGYANWEEYVLQTCPTNAGSRLSVSIRMEGNVPQVSYEPKTFLDGYQAVVKGTNDLRTSPDNWIPITDSTPTTMFHFFKVEVTKPASP